MKVSGEERKADFGAGISDQNLGDPGSQFAPPSEEVNSGGTRTEGGKTWSTSGIGISVPIHAGDKFGQSGSFTSSDGNTSYVMAGTFAPSDGTFTPSAAPPPPAPSPAPAPAPAPGPMPSLVTPPAEGSVTSGGGLMLLLLAGAGLGAYLLSERGKR